MMIMMMMMMVMMIDDYGNDEDDNDDDGYENINEKYDHRNHLKSYQSHTIFVHIR